MKLNQNQKIALALWLGEKVTGLWRNTGIVSEYDDFCNGDPRYVEWRIIHPFGMAGKIWNVYNEIYVTGWSSCEMDKKEYKKHAKVIDKWNEEIRELLADHT
jgi:hypothetical protein